MRHRYFRDKAKELYFGLVSTIELLLIASVIGVGYYYIFKLIFMLT